MLHIPAAVAVGYFRVLEVDRFNPLKGEGYIDSTAAINTKKAVINVKNKDNRCFEYAILSELHHDEIKEYPKDHQHIKHTWVNLFLQALNSQFH